MTLVYTVFVFNQFVIAYVDKMTVQFNGSKG